jgi:hypothetical protein
VRLTKRKSGRGLCDRRRERGVAAREPSVTECTLGSGSKRRVENEKRLREERLIRQRRTAEAIESLEVEGLLQAQANSNRNYSALKFMKAPKLSQSQKS